MAVTTERLVLRQPGEGDRAAYRDLLFNPEVEAWLRPRPMRPFTEADPVTLLDRDLRHWDDHGYGPWVVLDGERADLAFLGRAGLEWTAVEGERAVELAWALVPGAQGRGLATEAAVAAVAEARAQHLDALVSFTLPDNAASRRVMEKTGMTYDRDITHAGLRHVLYRLRLDDAPA